MALCPSWRAFLCLLVFPSIALAYVWPNPQLDELESQRYDRMGYNARALAEGVTPCNNFLLGDTVGRANAADWLRTAYHDMATYNVADGTGGLDASIRFEFDRGENVGNGFPLTVLLLSGEANRYVSLADILALGAVTAVEQCGGPKINFRGGRVDATVANNPGVPEPQQDIATHTAAFVRQGFTQSEMIGLVACGHTFGGVQHQNFPDIVPASNDPNNTSGNVHFDSTFVTFDNRIATDYLDGKTHNPLVVGPTETDSDKRIFSCDGNVTMHSFRDPEVFAKTCADLLARMIDTVPRGVQLTDVIEPMPVKPKNVHLVYTKDDTIHLNGDLRLWNKHEDPNRTVQLHWVDRDGHECRNCSRQLGHTANMAGRFLADGTEITSMWYSFNRTATQSVVINANSSISKFWFDINEGGHITTEDQNNVGYEVQDVVMLADSSCRQDLNLTVGIAIRKGVTPTRVYFEADDFTDGLPVIRTVDIPTTSKPSGKGMYNVWTVSDSTLVRSWNIAVDVGHTKFATANLQNHTFPSCT